jgi:hypothetical protein
MFFLNELAPEDVRGLLVFDLYIQYSGLSGTKFQTGSSFVLGSYVVFGLDMRFLGGNGKKKNGVINKFN